MKAMMISKPPKIVANVLNDLASILIFKTCPKDWKDYLSGKTKEMPKSTDVYFYCTKYENNKTNTLAKMKDSSYQIIKSVDDVFKNIENIEETKFTGKVVAKFTLNKVEEIAYQKVFEQNPFHYLEEESGYGTETLNTNEFKKETCLTDKELEDYLNTDKPNKKAYAWHISNLEIFDKPKELSEFKRCQLLWNCEPHDCKACRHLISLTKVHQSYCFVEVE